MVRSDFTASLFCPVALALLVLFGCRADVDSVIADDLTEAQASPTASPAPVSSPVPSSTPVPPTAEPTSPPGSDAGVGTGDEAQRLARVVDALVADGFIIEPGAEGDADAFARLIDDGTDGATPFYIVSVVGEPVPDFADDVRDAIGPPANVLVYWSDGEWVGVQLATGEPDDRESLLLTPFDTDWTTPDEFIAEVAFLLGAPAVAAQLPAEVAELLLSYPNVTAEAFGDVIVLTGTVPSAETLAALNQAMSDLDIPFQNQAQVDGRSDSSLLDVIEAQPELSSYLSVVEEADLTSLLESEGPVTVIAVTNDGLASWVESVGELRFDSTHVQQFVLSHALEGEDSVADLAGMTHLALADGAAIEVAFDEDGGVVFNETANLLVETLARNGRLLIVDSPVVD